MARVRALAPDREPDGGLHARPPDRDSPLPLLHRFGDGHASSIVEGAATLRRLAFDPILTPLSASVSIGITFCVNLLAFVVFAAIQQIQPWIEWLLLVPLLAELYLFTVGLDLLLSAVYVRFRDISQVWELAASLLFFACAISYPVGILRDWA